MADELEVAPEIEIIDQPIAEETAEVPPVTVPDPPPTKIRKIIQPMDANNKPLGAPHVYEGDTFEEVNAKMAEAIANGTRKIHELSRRATLDSQKAPEGAEVDVEAPVWTPRDLTDDEKFLIKTEPDKAFDISFKAKFGCTPEEFSARQNRRDEDAKVTREKAETEIFKEDHPEFVICNENRDAIIQYMQKHNLKWRKKNLDIAFRELSESGLLKLRSEEVAPVVDEPAPVVEEVRTEPTPIRRAAQPEFPAVIRNTSSRATVPIKVKDGKPTAEQIADMTADEWAKYHPELRNAR